MPRVSRIPLRHEEDQRIHDAFLRAIAALRTKSDVENFLLGFLTPSEWKMFAKRLAIADMLLSGDSYAKIEMRLKVGNATISRMKNFLELHGAGVKKLIQQLKNL